MVEVVIDSKSLRRSRASGPVTGEIWIRWRGRSLPEDHWRDFPVVILEWWIQGLREVVEGKEDGFRGRFMDGPFSFAVQPSGAGNWRLFWDEDGQEAPLGRIDVKALLVEVVRAAKKVVKACRAHKWGGCDLRLLESATRVTTEGDAA